MQHLFILIMHTQGNYVDTSRSISCIGDKKAIYNLSFALVSKWGPV